MTVLHVLSFSSASRSTLAILGSALETVVLPQEGFSRISQAVFAGAYRLLVHQKGSPAEARTLRSLYAPVSLVSLPLVWMIFMVIAFTFVFWGTGNEASQRAFEHSASSLTTLGFSEPNGTGKIVIAFVEATIGLGLVALLISYLPTIFTAYNSREKGINRLRPDRRRAAQRDPAAADPSPHRLARGHRLLASPSPTGCSTWSRPTPPSPSSPTSPRPIRTTPGSPRSGPCSTRAALVVATTDDEGDEVYQDAEKGPIMVVVYGLPLIVRIARAANVPLPPSQGLPDLSARAAMPAPEIAVTRAEFDAALDALDAVLAVPPDRRDESWRRFALIRSVYEPSIRALAGLTAASPAPWTTDRPARRRPPALPAPPTAPRGLVDAAARAGAGRRRPRYRWLKPPDSSLVIGTVTG